MYIRAMVKEFLMKKLLISLGVFACVTVNAQTASDSVVMTVAGKQVPLSEFIYRGEEWRGGFIEYKVRQKLCRAI